MLFSRKSLAKLIIPICIEQALITTMGLIDSMMVAGAGEAAVSGVALVDSINIFINQILISLASGGSIVISQLIGRGDKRIIQEGKKQLLWAVGLIGLALTLIMLVCGKPLINVLFGKAENEVLKNAYTYMLFTALTYPFLGIYTSCSSIFRAHGNSTITMTVSIFSSLLHVGLNAILIFWLKMGVAGAAISTLATKILETFAVLCVICNKKRPERVENLLKYKPNVQILKQICGVGIPNGLENSLIQLGGILTSSIISGLGTAQIAANAVALKIVNVQYIPGTGFNVASATVIGQCVGAGEKEQAKRYSKLLLTLSYISFFIIAVVICALLSPIMRVFNISAEATSLCILIVLIHSVIAFVTYPVMSMTPNVFKASGDVAFSVINSIASFWLLRIGLGALLCLVFSMGIMGMWIGTFACWVYRAIVFSIRYFKGTWLNKYKKLVIEE